VKLVFSNLVEPDLDDIAVYIAKGSRRYAIQTVRKIRNEFRTIAARPFLFAAQTEIYPDVRRALVGDYVILFRVLPDRVRIERVVHGSRDLPQHIH
jgi:toxin ParE1/3/4